MSSGPRSYRPSLVSSSELGIFWKFLVVCLALLTLACSSETTGENAPPRPVSSLEDNQQFVQAEVVEVIDGATIDVKIDGKVYRVAYLGLSIPETGLTREQAIEFNRFMVEGRAVQLERGSVETDLSGNLLRYAYVDGEMVNLTLVANGYAVVSDFPSAFKHQASFLQAEESARANLQGVWRQANPAAGRDNPQSPSGQQGASTQTPELFSTLPPPPPSSVRVCDFSGTDKPVIKGPQTGNFIYLVPESQTYLTTSINEAQGDRWFCTELEAAAAGWSPSDEGPS